jgi:hypothetical protein
VKTFKEYLEETILSKIKNQFSLDKKKKADDAWERTKDSAADHLVNPDSKKATYARRTQKVLNKQPMRGQNPFLDFSDLGKSKEDDNAYRAMHGAKIQREDTELDEVDNSKSNEQWLNRYNSDLEKSAEYQQKNIDAMRAAAKKKKMSQSKRAKAMGMF